MPITAEQQEILDDLAEAAEELEALFPERATVTGPGAATTTRSGDRVPTTVEKLTDVPVRISTKAGGTERLIAQTMQVVEPYIISLPIRFLGQLAETDRITVGARTFAIRSIPVTSYAVQVRCICEETS